MRSVTDLSRVLIDSRLSRSLHLQILEPQLTLIDAEPGAREGTVLLAALHSEPGERPRQGDTPQRPLRRVTELRRATLGKSPTCLLSPVGLRMVWPVPDVRHHWPLQVTHSIITVSTSTGTGFLLKTPACPDAQNCSTGPCHGGCPWGDTTVSPRQPSCL